MHHIDVVTTSEPVGGASPFRHNDLSVDFHVWRGTGALPGSGAALWLFIDWVLPDMSGFELCRRLRADPATAEAHVTLVLETEDAEASRGALRAGADDFLVGPMSRASLLGRVLASRPRNGTADPQRRIVLGDLVVDSATVQARWRGQPISLLPMEFRLLRHFASHPDQLFSREELIAALGRQEPPINERTVDAWVARLRKALREAGAGSPLRTVRWRGYVMDSPGS